MDFSLPKLGSGLLNKVADAVGGAVKEGVEKVGEGVEAIGNGVEAVAEAVADATTGTMGDGDVHIEAQMGGYGTSRTSSSTRTRSSLTL